MDIHKKVISLGLAIKINAVASDLKVKLPKSQYAYYKERELWTSRLVEVKDYEGINKNFIKSKLLPAYDASEMGIIIGDTITHSYLGKSGFYISAEGSPEILQKTEAEARGVFVLYLLKKGIL